jgi:hypothetical protein
LVIVLNNSANTIDVEYVECSSKAEAVDKERELIATLRPLYNKAPQAGGWKGMHSEEGLESISQANTGRVFTEEEKEARSHRMKGNKHLLGHKHSQETKEKISQSLQGREISEKTRISASERMSERNRNNPPRKGEKLSEAHRLKLSIAAKNRKKKSCT